MELKQEKVILNGKFKLVTELSEFRMALWINGFGVYDALTNEVITPLVHSFNLDKYEESDNVLKIEFRIYPNGSKSYQVEINPFQKVFRYEKQLYPTKKFEELFWNEYSKNDPQKSN